MHVPLHRYFALLWRYLKSQKWRFVLLAVLVFGGIGLQLLIPQFTRFVIDTATGQESDIVAASTVDTVTDNALIVAALAFIGVAVFQQVITISASYLGETVAWSATNELRADLMRYCLGLDLGFHHATTPGALIERIDGDVSLLADFFSKFFVQILGSLLLTFGILIVLFAEDARVGIAFVGFTLFALVTLYRVRNLAMPAQKALRDANTELSGFLEERLAGVEDLRSSGATNYVIYGLFRLHALIRRRWMRAILLQSLLASTGGMLLAVGYVVAFLCGYFLYSSGALSLGGVYLVMNYMALLNRPLNELSRQVESLQTIGASIERVEALFATPNAMTESKQPLSLDSNPVSVTFNAVTFIYQAGVKVLDDVTFEVDAGKVLGIIGRTGSGKSTIARLLMRFYDPQAGGILFNKIDLRQLAQHDLRQRAALVTQEVQLFEGNVRDNLTFFDAHIADADILAALDLLELSAWLRGLSAGLDTPLEAGGRGLSAGEAQLLAFARVLLRQPDLIILDEATSRLDPATEARLERAVTRLLDGRTGIIIAHRLETLKHADHILILEASHVVEYGERVALANDPNSRYYHLLQLGEGALL